MAHIIETAFFPKKLSPKERIRVLVDQHRMRYGLDADAEAEILAMSYHRMKAPEKDAGSYRWLPKVNCDQFFETGKLRLSTIQGFGNDADRSHRAQRGAEIGAAGCTGQCLAEADHKADVGVGGVG